MASAIREGGLESQWNPLLKNNDGVKANPHFHAYLCGHASFGLTADEPRAMIKTRHFTSFSGAAKEDADSRLWLGVHFLRDDTETASPSATKVSNQVFTAELRTL
ncbi:hypothetical protein EES41_02835 [Streptomyces sp. ADI95-16]|uniref:hypothetical protein n=1 Tax=Streptomyces sp. ADI95-16 TaxID=1522758 RepID=UPI000F3A91E3|nr:hypothetical protein [Streptomyces sp. ADI95-16]AYV25669.1 hypothetical protein EES41_02835 [Streptomyces sp. ADI95-16]